jgi:hypothetical protein
MLLCGLDPDVVRAEQGQGDTFRRSLSELASKRPKTHTSSDLARPPHGSKVLQTLAPFRKSCNKEIRRAVTPRTGSWGVHP